MAAGILVALFVVMFDPDEMGWLPSGRWIAFLAYTVLIFCIVIYDARRCWAQPMFWVALGGLGAVHILGYRVLLKSIDEWRNVWFVPLSILEITALRAVLSMIGRNDESHRTEGASNGDSDERDSSAQEPR